MLTNHAQRQLANSSDKLAGSTVGLQEAVLDGDSRATKTTCEGIGLIRDPRLADSVLNAVVTPSLGYHGSSFGCIVQVNWYATCYHIWEAGELTWILSDSGCCMRLLLLSEGQC